MSYLDEQVILESLKGMFKPKIDYTLIPIQWIGDKLGEFVWSKQAEILDSVRDNVYTAVHSCHDAGKSFIASRIINWWIDSHKPGEAFVVSTAPSAAQVSAVLWREMSKAHLKAKERGTPMPGRINRAGYPQWYIDGVLVGYGRKPADYQDSVFQGIHDKAVLVVLDEAGGIKRAIWDGVDAITTNEDVKVVAIGNPDSTGTHFHNVCTPGHKLSHGWNVIRIDALTSPNMSEQYILRQQQKGQLTQAEVDRLYQVMADAEVEAAELGEEFSGWSTEEVPDELRKMLISPRWIATQAQRWGTKSSLWQAKIRGRFPDDSSEGVIPLGWVRAAQRRWTEWVEAGRPRDWNGRRIIACDVARFGPDATVIGIRHGRIVEKLVPHQGRDTSEVTQLLQTTGGLDADKASDIAHTRFVIDANGIGGGVVDQMRRDKVKNVVAFNGSERDDRRDRTGSYDFRNNRSAAYWNLREKLDPLLGEDIMLPDDEQLTADLTCPTWGVQVANARIYVEEREEVKKRLGQSPDYGDCVAMLFWQAADTPGQEDVLEWTQPRPMRVGAPVDPDDEVIQWS